MQQQVSTSYFQRLRKNDLHSIFLKATVFQMRKGFLVQFDWTNKSYDVNM